MKRNLQKHTFKQLNLKYIIVGFLIIIQFVLGSQIRIHGNNFSESNIVYASNRQVRVAFKYDTGSSMWIDFKSGGVNSIFGISKISIGGASTNSLEEVLKNKEDVLMKSETDWIGPYIVKSNTNGNSNQAAFTGGWHGFNGDGTGTPTAKTISFLVFADDIKVEENKIIICNKVRITVVNLVQAYNTKSIDGKGRPVLKETIDYTISGNKIDVETRIEALESITIERYYGLQTQNNLWRDTITYGDGDTVNGYINSSGIDISQFTLKANGNALTAWIDNKYD
ncbi:MAG: hypothetical protein K0R50_4863, partial [Eubacterium sp.]|nr:hypothetical protein [Eubacterium sp.]